MKLSLGIDTSNYKTSIGLTDSQGNILMDLRRFLDVPKGSKGLRQQEAFFQHVNKLPEMLEELFKEYDSKDIEIISVSDRPRPIEGSYMPCFMAGVSIGKVLADTIGCPLKFFSHQEGHIRAGLHNLKDINEKEFLAFHFSGGTTEALHCKKNSEGSFDIEIVGGTKDISFGQLIDRVGVKMGMDFPAGEEIDSRAMKAYKKVEDKFLEVYDHIPKTKVRDHFINLSGIETALIRTIEALAVDPKGVHDDSFCLILLTKIGDIIKQLIPSLSFETEVEDCLLVGGVSSSCFLREYLSDSLPYIKLHFADRELSSDNAVGIALLGGDRL